MFSTFFAKRRTFENFSKNIWVECGVVAIIAVKVLLHLFIINPLVPRVQKIKIRNFTLNQLLVVEFVKKTGHFRYFLTFSIIKDDFLHFLSS